MSMYSCMSNILNYLYCRPDQPIGSSSLSLNPVVNQIGKEVVLSAEIFNPFNIRIGNIEVVARFTANSGDVVAAVLKLVDKDSMLCLFSLDHFRFFFHFH